MPCSAICRTWESSIACCAASPRHRCRPRSPTGSSATSAILGAPFLVMERVPGACPNPSGRDGRRPSTPRRPRAGVLPASFTATLATLHTLDWRGAGLDFLGAGRRHRLRATGDREVARADRRLRASARSRSSPTSSAGSRPMPRRRSGPRSSMAPIAPAISDPRGPDLGRARLGASGPRRSDVRCRLRPERSQPRRDTAPVQPRRPRRLLRDYEAATGFTIDEEVCRYYNVLYAMRSAAFWMSASGLYAAGRSNDLRLARTAWSVPVVLERAARDLGYPARAPVRTRTGREPRLPRSVCVGTGPSDAGSRQKNMTPEDARTGSSGRRGRTRKFRPRESSWRERARSVGHVLEEIQLAKGTFGLR